MRKQIKLTLTVAAALAAFAGTTTQAATLITTSGPNIGGNAPVSAADLLNGLAPTASSGTFTNESSGGISFLTDGLSNVANATVAGISSGSFLTYTLTGSATGYDITSIDAFSGWADFGRANPEVRFSYSLISDPLNFIILGTNVETAFNNDNGAGDVYVRVTVADDTQPNLATGVAALRFDFPDQQNGFVGYRELDAFGTPTAVPEPSTYLMMLGGLATLVIFRRRSRVA